MATTILTTIKISLLVWKISLLQALYAKFKLDICGRDLQSATCRWAPMEHKQLL